MTAHLTTATPSECTSHFHQRCEELGLAAWRFAGDGSLIATPDRSNTIGAWLNSPALRSRIEKQAKVSLDDGQCQAAEFFPGCWLLPLPDPPGSAQPGLTVVLALGQAALEHEWFQVICTAAALDAQAARQSLAPIATHKQSDIETLFKLLQWSQNDLAQTQLNEQAIDLFSNRLIQAYEETNLLFKLARYMNQITEPIAMMQSACAQVHMILPFQWTAILFNHSAKVTGALAGQFFLTGELPCDQDALRKAVDKLLNQLSQDNWTRLLDPQHSDVAAMVNSEIVLDPIMHDNVVVGGLLAGNKGGPDPDVSSVETQFLDAMADLLSVFHQNICRFAEQRDMFMGTLRALTASVDAKDAYTRGHSERVAVMAEQLAVAMGMPTTKAERVRISGIVHDVGKIGVPEAVLCKRGRLTDEEFEQIKKHPTIGYNILKDIPPMRDILPGVLCHHERWDGGGYPDGLSGQDIPILGRILALADTFDAMSSDRSYRSALDRTTVLNEIRLCAGTQFDPELADLFVSLKFDVYDQMILQHESESHTQ